MAWETHALPAAYDLLAPDGSEIRLLGRVEGGSMVHCTVRPGQTTQAVKHKTVEELWLCTAGAGELWRANDDGEQVVRLRAGTAVTIPLGTRFQFRATGPTALELVIATIPPWPGADEAVAVDGTWR